MDFMIDLWGLGIRFEPFRAPRFLRKATGNQKMTGFWIEFDISVENLTISHYFVETIA